MSTLGKVLKRGKNILFSPSNKLGITTRNMAHVKKYLIVTALFIFFAPTTSECE